MDSLSLHKVEMAAAAPIDIIAQRNSRVTGKENLLNLLMYTDSYHDFKSERGKVGGTSCVPFIDQYMNTNKTTLPNGGPTKGDRSEVLKYYSSLGIQFSKLEQSTRQYFEQQLPKTLYGTPENGTIPTVVRYTDIIGTLKGKIGKADVICLELDHEYQSKLTAKNMSDKNKSVGFELLSWLFPAAAGAKQQVGFSFDAKTALINDLMTPCNNTSDPFHAVHIITPQNILDSARTSFNVLPGILANSGTPSRLQFIDTLHDEYANHLTSALGRFKVVSAGYGDKNHYGFKWQFEFLDKSKGIIDIPVNDMKNSGPSVNFLANMALSCNAQKVGNPRGACLSKIANQPKNATMTNPAELLKSLSQEDFKKLCIDIKRLGDHEQANAVYAAGVDKLCVFVTGDTLSALYSRILGNPTMYVSTPGGAGDDDGEGGSNSSILCYRGIIKNLTPEQAAIRDLEYILDTINYILFTYQQFSSLAESSSLKTLIENIETFAPTYQYKDVGLSPDIQQLMTNLIKWRVYDIYAHIQNVYRTFASSKDMIATALATFRDKAKIAADPKHGYNIALITKGDRSKIAATISSLNAALTEKLRADIKQMNSMLSFFNNAKAFDADGNTIFTFHYQLFYSPTKIVETLPFFNFNLSDIKSIGIIFARLNTGKVMRSSTDNILRESLSNAFNVFISKFYNTVDDGVSKYMKDINDVISRTVFIKDGSVDKTVVTSLIGELNTYATSEGEKLAAVRPAVKVGGAGGEGSLTMLESPSTTSSSNSSFNSTKSIQYRGQWYSPKEFRDAHPSKPSPIFTPFQGPGRSLRNTLPGDIYTAIVNAVIPLFTNPEYEGMFTVVTGDKALYGQTSDFVGEQRGGEIISSSPGYVESDYYYSHQFYRVVQTLEEMADICSQYSDVDDATRAKASAAEAKLSRSEEIDASEEEAIANVAHTTQLFDRISDLWLRMDAELTTQGSPDFSIEPSYPKATYNDIRRDTNYQRMNAYMTAAYSQGTFKALCASAAALKGITVSIDTAIDNLPTTLKTIADATGVAAPTVNAAIDAVNQAILYDKITKLNAYVALTFVEFGKMLKGASAASIKSPLTYNVRQIEQLVDDISVFKTDIPYVNKLKEFVTMGKDRLSSKITDIASGSQAWMRFTTPIDGKEPSALFNELYSAYMGRRIAELTPAKKGGARRFDKTRSKRTKRRYTRKY